MTLRVYTGPCTILVANTSLDSYDFRNCLNGLSIVANNVTISRSHIYDSVHGQEQNGFAFTITDSLIDGAQTSGPAIGKACVNCGVDGWNWTVLRTEIVHTNRGAYCMNHCTLQDSWIHDTNLDTSPCPQAPYNTCPHASAVRAEQFATIAHNSLWCDYGQRSGDTFNQDLGCSADMSGYADFVPIHDNLIQGNLFMANAIGLGFCAYGGGTTKPHTNDPPGPVRIRFVDNVFQRGTGVGAQGGLKVCGTWGPITDFLPGSTNVWSGNVWDTGGSVPPG